MISHLLTGVSNNICMSWVFIMVGPVIFMIATMFARAIEALYTMSK